ncbi:hypothetical protein [Flavobacterium gawalongense]|uniref:Uncharacterized protein n=1 Tax=Flavobacterium gawalongense TaxID=2594432 RepID=A0ABY3CL51_9FLAO|nr:hypothetical protein [Flavobacterium gawalongense]TRX01879.1 hypothetical protein FNW33_08255 [Flavobacterium gawalongense]TRX06333.1 hypothetical protein FNW12_08790 [Flavobacterium gawalongense]
MEILKWLFGKKNDDVKEIESQENNDFKITKVGSEHEPMCPYCKTSLNKFPSRKTKCPHCRNFIFVRKLNDSRLKTLVTEEQVQEIEIEQKKNYLRYNRLRKLKEFGVTEDEFVKRKEELYLKSGIENNEDDAFWSIFNELLSENANDVNQLRMDYYSMAIFLYEEGRDNFKLLQLNAKATLDSFQLSNLELKVEIVGCSDSCEACKKLNGKIISIEEAYLLPIPCRECTHRIGFCRCFYCSVSSRDSEGMLIFKK